MVSILQNKLFTFNTTNILLFVQTFILPNKNIYYTSIYVIPQNRTSLLTASLYPFCTILTNRSQLFLAGDENSILRSKKSGYGNRTLTLGYIMFLSRAQTLFSGAQTLLIRTQTLLFGAQTILFKSQTLFSGAQTLLFRTRTLLFRAQTLFFEAQTILFKSQTLLFRAQTIFYGAQTLLFRAQTFRPRSETPGPRYQRAIPVYQPILLRNGHSR